MRTIKGNYINHFAYGRISNMHTMLSLKNYQSMICHVRFDVSTVVKIHPLVFWFETMHMITKRSEENAASTFKKKMKAVCIAEAHR